MGQAMREHAEPIDVATSPELRRVAEQLRLTRQPVPLMQGNEVIAVVQPASRRRGKRASNLTPNASAHAPASTVQSPDDFYSEAVARPDVAEILRRLAR
jgi:hypothetical protein